VSEKRRYGDPQKGRKIFPVAGKKLPGFDATGGLNVFHSAPDEAANRERKNFEKIGTLFA